MNTKYDRTYKRVYRMLRDTGHSGLVALNILWDARRGSRHALDWIRTLRNLIR